MNSPHEIARCAPDSSGTPKLRDPYRPLLHFAPRRHWANDPNGLVFHEGRWHLFFQHNPNGDGWDDMSWGHAVSDDLVSWDERPVAIPQSVGADGRGSGERRPLRRALWPAWRSATWADGRATT